MAKRITFDRETRDFRMELDGEIVGYAATHTEAEEQLDAIAYERLRRQGPVSAAA